jgi:hypothetical protein
MVHLVNSRELLTSSRVVMRSDQDCWSSTNVVVVALSCYPPKPPNRGRLARTLNQNINIGKPHIQLSHPPSAGHASLLLFLTGPSQNKQHSDTSPPGPEAFLAIALRCIAPDWLSSEVESARVEIRSRRSTLLQLNHIIAVAPSAPCLRRSGSECLARARPVTGRSSR